MRCEGKRKEDQAASDIETLRSQKDAKIRQQERDKEDQRSQYEVKINNLESNVRSKSRLKHLV